LVKVLSGYTRAIKQSNQDEAKLQTLLDKLFCTMTPRICRAPNLMCPTDKYVMHLNAVYCMLKGICPKPCTVLIIKIKICVQAVTVKV